MISRLLPLLSTLIPGNIASKALSKINPNIANFFQGAALGGYGIDESLDFLREKFENPSTRQEKNRLKKGEAQGTLRPDEKSSLQTINQSQNIPNAIESLIKGGGRALGGLTGVSLGREQPQPQNPPQSPPQERRPEPGSRQEAAVRLGEMRKRKSLIDELQADFERDFGPSLEPERNLSSNNSSKEELLNTARAIADALKKLNG